MPANTPIYGFTYPCPGDTVDAASFALLANQIDTKLLSVQADQDYAVGRYVSFNQAVNQGGIVAGVETPIASAFSTYVVPADGVYSVTVRWRLTATTIAGARLRVRRAGTPLFGRTINTDGVVSSTPNQVVTGVMTAVTGNVIDCSILFQGTGAGTSTSLQIGVRQIVRIL